MNFKFHSFFLISFIIALVTSSFIYVFYLHNNNSNKTSIYAASSLRPLLDYAFVSFNDDLLIQYNGTQVLKHQILNGADVDLFFCASEIKCLSMYHAKNICTNKLVFIVNKKIDISNMSEIADYQFDIAMASKDVPLGTLTTRYLIQENQKIVNKLIVNTVSNDLSAGSILSRLESKQVQAAFLYESYFYNNKKLMDAYKLIPLNKNFELTYYYQIINDNSDTSMLVEAIELLIKNNGCEQFGFGKR
jgi:ABC-type molybdate transport system substrate-binding protein|tara:strand:- start:625 stop:1365 length:741 start_codon:yes stop_codon:yes gene_type:complete